MDSSITTTEESTNLESSSNNTEGQETEGQDTDESSMPTSILEYIYDDEILPEIEIREVISIDEVLRSNPRFVALSDETIYILIKQFIDKGSIANGFLKLHKHVIHEDTNTLDILNNIYYYTDDLIRKDTSKIFDYLNDIEKALIAPSFELQRIELNKLAYPFEIVATPDEESELKTSKTESSNDSHLKIDEPSNIILNNNPYDISKTLSYDNASIPINGAFWKLLPYNKYTYIHELLESKPLKYIKWDPKYKTVPLNTWIQPRFKNIVDEIKTIDSLHKYKIILAQYGYDIENLTIKQDNVLNEHMKTLEENETKTDETKHTSKNYKYPSFKLLYSVSSSYLDVIQKYQELYNAYFKEERLFRIQQMLGSYIASLPNFQKELDYTDPYTLFTEVIQGTSTFEDINNLITQLNIRNNFNQANNLLKELSASHTYYDLEQFKIFYNETEKSIIDDRNTPFITLYDDIKDVVIGNDTSKYDGTPYIIPETVYEENQYETYTEPREEEDVNPDEEVYDSIPDKIIEKFPNYYEVHEGIRELLNFILPYLVLLKDSTGLEWDINLWIKSYSIETQRHTRISKIKQVLPDVNDFILERICVNSFETSMQRITELNTISIAETLTRIYPTIYKEWQDDCKDAFFNALSNYLLDVLDLSLNGTLEFSILNGAVEFADLWSPYGPPLGDKKTKTGVIYYLSAVATNVLPYDNITEEIIEEKILKLITDKYTVRLNKLQELWEKVKEKKDKQDKTSKIKKELEETTRKLLAKEKINFLPTYVKSYFYLPIFIPKKEMVAFKKQPIWAQGCCLSTIDKNYEADNDWKNYIKPLWSMKNKLAEDRWLTRPREDLYILNNKNVTEKIKTDVKKIDTCYTPSDTESEVKEELFEPNDLWLERSQYNILRDDPRNGGMNLAIQCLRFTYRNDQANRLTDIIQSITQMNDIYHLLIKIIQNINKKLHVATINTTEYRVLQTTLNILNDMKNVITLFLKSVATKYTTNLYRAKYILARAICLPGIPQRNRISLPDDVATNFYSNIIKDNYNTLIQWNKTNAMLTPNEIQAYITKMREENKKDTLKKLDELSVDDIQLMKDVKRFGLTKTLEKEKEINTESNEDIPIYENEGDFENQEGEAEWLQTTTDPETLNDDLLDSIL